MATLTTLLAGDGLVLCLALTHARTPDFPLIAAAIGYDAVYVDLEHASTSWDTVAVLCAGAAGAGLGSLVRLPSREPDVVARALDVGAEGVIAPHVGSKADAENLVAAAHFPPRGTRSLAGPNVVTGYGPMTTAERLATVHGRTVVVAMIESLEGVQSAEAIAAVEGIDMLLVGPHDLSAQLRVPGQIDHDEVTRAINEVASVCRSTGTVFGIAGVRSTTALQGLVDQGLRFISAGTDAQFFTEAAQQRAAELREITLPRGVTPAPANGGSS
jgi:4-hydroxy-2-oxoheptanedioate aldolase